MSIRYRLPYQVQGLRTTLYYRVHPVSSSPSQVQGLRVTLVFKDEQQWKVKELQKAGRSPILAVTRPLRPQVLSHCVEPDFTPDSTFDLDVLFRERRHVLYARTSNCQSIGPCDISPFQDVTQKRDPSFSGANPSFSEEIQWKDCLSYRASINHATVHVSYTTLRRRSRGNPRQLPHLAGQGQRILTSHAISHCTRKDSVLRFRQLETVSIMPMRYMNSHPTFVKTIKKLSRE